MKNVIAIVDPESYGLNRTAVLLGLSVLVVAIVLCSKLLSVLHAAGLPQVQ